jgi:pathogenesis-related protein 1
MFWLLILLAGTSEAQGPRSSLASAMLAAHNTVRVRVGVAPLVWSNRLAGSAQDWAATLLAHKQFFHRPNSAHGENLFEIEGAISSPKQVVDTWAAESRNYDHSSNKCRGVCGHYTQVIWGDTKEVGCAVAQGGRREVWVCEYDPPGNWVGKRPY